MCAHFLTNSPLCILCSNEDDRFHNSKVCPLKVLCWIIDCKMIYVFPYLCIVYCVLFMIPIANCELKDHFLYENALKICLYSTMGVEILSLLARLNIENEILESLDFEEIIHDFIKAKSIKKWIHQCFLSLNIAMLIVIKI